MADSQNESDAQPRCQLRMSRNVMTTSTNAAESENRRWRCYILDPACIPLDTMISWELVCKSCTKSVSLIDGSQIHVPKDTLICRAW